MLFDKVAVLNSLSEEQIINMFTLDNVELFLRSLGVESIEKHKDYLVCPTICHNTLDNAESMKLYYYDNNKSFHCYTQCSENFNIIELYRRYMSLNHQETTYAEANYFIRGFFADQNIIEPHKHVAKYSSNITEYKIDPIITLPEYNDKILDAFSEYYHPAWLEEGITKNVQKKFNIKFSLGNNRIIIPHYDIDGRLVGIRCRNFEENDLIYGKYRPLQLGQSMFNHQLGFNLYGIYEHAKAIRKTKRVIIYEGEKSVLKDDVFFGDYSVAVATCGSQLNKFQISLLTRKLGVNEIILAFDKEYDNCFSLEGRKYREKLIKKCEKYRGLATFYYIFDEHNYLKKKDAPCDRGYDTLITLIKEKILIK